MCGTPISTSAPLLCCLRLPLPIHLCQLWCPVLYRALSRHPPGDQVSLEHPPGPYPLLPRPHNFPGSLLILGFLHPQVPKVDCVSLSVFGEEGPLCIALALERTSPKRKVLPWTKRGAIHWPSKAQCYPQDCRPALRVLL